MNDRPASEFIGRRVTLNVPPQPNCAPTAGVIVDLGYNGAVVDWDGPHPNRSYVSYDAITPED